MRRDDRLLGEGEYPRALNHVIDAPEAAGALPRIEALAQRWPPSQKRRKFITLHHLA